MEGKHHNTPRPPGMLILFRDVISPLSKSHQGVWVCAYEDRHLGCDNLFVYIVDGNFQFLTSCSMLKSITVKCKMTQATKVQMHNNKSNLVTWQGHVASVYSL